MNKESLTKSVEFIVNKDVDSAKAAFKDFLHQKSVQVMNRPAPAIADTTTVPPTPVNKED